MKKSIKEFLINKFDTEDLVKYINNDSTVHNKLKKMTNGINELNNMHNGVKPK